MSEQWTTIDAIARQRQSDVLMVTFFRPEESELDEFDYATCAVRNKALAWFDQQGIGYRECFDLWPDNDADVPYLGELFIDVPVDENNPRYLDVVHKFEHEDGSSRYLGVSLFIIPLSLAQEYRHRDKA
ncbi:hypothetical protein JV213_08290 [Plesiomonas shigelloides]|uniref:hypothetical protein n=1 Tax=Plesiomonas shigelloides TaxID=703 RepID=UPI001C0586A1|nr:hypothetical protein [Plesiomonas shigelloides]QWK96141.1 hypothetical protein JV213_08290 [Plesiomonas shigelloides]